MKMCREGWERMKWKNRLKRLEARRKAFDNNKSNSTQHRPGSMKK